MGIKYGEVEYLLYCCIDDNFRLVNFRIEELELLCRIIDEFWCKIGLSVSVLVFCMFVLIFLMLRLLFCGL